LIFTSFSVLYLFVLGQDGTFLPGTYDLRWRWIIISIVLSFFVAIVGGYVARMVGKANGAVVGLAGIVLVLGILVVLSQTMMSDQRPTVRSGNVPNMEAMGNARQPTWIAILNPLIGVVGVLIGGRMRKEP
jgi:amino acid transporter